MSRVEQVARGVYRIHDTCNVYLIVSDAEGPERTAVAIDFGDGTVLDHLEELGVDRISHVLMTHHHRDQGQGLPRAVEAGIPILVPPVEVDLFRDVDELWRTRQLDLDYNLRQDRFSLLESVPVAGTVPEYRAADFDGVVLTTVPTPGHTPGSVSYLLDRDGVRIAFSGDLIHSPGRVWSMAATQWSYSHHEGPAMTVLSCYLLNDHYPRVLMPSHGDPMAPAGDALEELAANMQEFVNSRRWHPWDLWDRLRYPWIQLTDHLLLNRSSMSCCYALLSDTGEALLVDFGYDVTTGQPAGNDRAARRPWLASLPALKEQFGVSHISVVLPTHYHDDHVAGMPLLRGVEGTEIWAPANVAPILADPWEHDLPCLWFEPIVADRVLPLHESVRWNEYEITVHPQPGHTLFAAAFEVEVDGVTVLFTGDQQEGLGVPGTRREFLNYQYRNRFRVEDYRDSAALYQRVAPGLMASGHWEPRWVEPGYLDMLADEGEFVIDIHRRLLPEGDFDLGAEGVAARLAPYRSRAAAGSEVAFRASIRNPWRHRAEATIRPVAPVGWRAVPESALVSLEPGEEAVVEFSVRVGDPVRRARIAIDVTIGELRLGQHAEALVDVD